MLAESAGLDEVVDRIRNHIDSQFRTGRAKVFLSSLGSDLPLEKKRSEELSGLKFGDFVEKKLGYPIGKTGTHNNVLFVVQPGTLSDVGDVSGPRFHMSFWTAFARPVGEGERRFINLSTFRFGNDKLEIGSASDDVREIDPKFIATEETSRNVADMLRRIGEWLDEQSLAQDRFLATPRKQKTVRQNLLSEVIDSLSPEQLRRTSLPLDVVKSLLAQAV